MCPESIAKTKLNDLLENKLEMHIEKVFIERAH